MATVHCPVYTVMISGDTLPYDLGKRLEIASYLGSLLSVSKPPDKTTDRITQTILRESQTQTDPYTPDVKNSHEKGLEVLTLGWLSWNNGLPAGMREAIVIERARQKRAWERALPIPVDPAAKKIRDMILEAIEVNEWTYREVELAAIGSIRFEMAQTCMRQNLSANKVKYENRMFKYVANKTEEKEDAIRKARLNLNRNLRKLNYQRRNANRKYKRMDVLTELNDKTSEFYGPQQRYGVDPRRGHEIIPPQFRYWNVFALSGIMEQKINFFYPERDSGFDYVEKSKPSKKYKELCLHETRWTISYLEKMYEQLKALRKLRMHSDASGRCKLKQRRERPRAQLQPPTVRAISDEEDQLYQASLFLQKTIKGRAIQAAMFEGRVRCQELIEELKSTHALQNYVEDVKRENRNRTFKQQRSKEVKLLEEKRKREILLSLEGKTVSEILDFLSKELLRIQNERVTHAIALMADRARHMREAEEAGRRQAEEQRAREFDEMYKQICKVYQNSVDMLEKELARDAKASSAAEHGRMKAEEYARRIDQAAREAQFRKNDIEDEEIVADLVHNFALPEVEKAIVRKRLNDRQKTMLSACHDEIYSKIEQLSRGARSSAGALIAIPRPAKHARPPTNYIKFLKLKRMSASASTSAETSVSVIEDSFYENYTLPESTDDAL